MLDVKTLKVLEFLNEHPDEAFSISLRGKCGMTGNFETMQWLTDKNMVYRYEDEDAHLFAYEEPEYTYQINAGGRQALAEQEHFAEMEKRAINAEARADESLRISKLSLAVAVIAIIAAWLK